MTICIALAWHCNALQDYISAKYRASRGCVMMAHTHCVYHYSSNIFISQFRQKFCGWNIFSDIHNITSVKLGEVVFRWGTTNQNSIISVTEQRVMSAVLKACFWENDQKTELSWFSGWWLQLQSAEEEAAVLPWGQGHHECLLDWRGRWWDHCWQWRRRQSCRAELLSRHRGCRSCQAECSPLQHGQEGGGQREEGGRGGQRRLQGEDGARPQPDAGRPGHRCPDPGAGRRPQLGTGHRHLLPREVTIIFTAWENILSPLSPAAWWPGWACGWPSLWSWWAAWPPSACSASCSPPSWSTPSCTSSSPPGWGFPWPPCCWVNTCYWNPSLFLLTPSISSCYRSHTFPACELVAELHRDCGVRVGYKDASSVQEELFPPEEPRILE